MSDDLEWMEFSKSRATVLAQLENTKNYMKAHNPCLCKGQVCCLHNRSAHHMRGFKQLFRYDRMMMERVCEHGVGHPDPDHLDYIRRERGESEYIVEGIHGCDGCCREGKGNHEVTGPPG